MPDTSLAIPQILSQHAEEAAFLWIIRDAAVRAPHYSLADLARLDGRIEAHLHGLLIGGEDAWGIVRDELRWQEPGEVFAAASVAFLSDEMARMQPVLEAARASIALSRGMISALGFSPYGRVAARISQLLGSEAPDVCRIGIAASAIHRMDPGQPLVDALSSDHAALRARALRAAGELGRRDLIPQLRAALSEANEDIQLWAAWSLGLLGDSGASDILKQLVRTDIKGHVVALDMALRLMELANANAWQRSLASDPSGVRLAILAAGIIGDPVSVPWLIEQMNGEQFARVAGEAFSSITGVDLALSKLERPQSAETQTGPSDNPVDDDVSMDPDENLAWPDVSRVSPWWSKNGPGFPAGRRLLLGQPLSAESLNQILRTGRQRQRAAAALELALLSAAKPSPLFETRAPAKRQKQTLGLIRR